MEALGALVQSLTSGDRLLAALRSVKGASSSDIPRLIAAVLNEKLAAGAGPGGGAAAAHGRQALDEALCVVDGLMFLHPRGKQQLALFADRCVVKTAKADISVPWTAIKHVAIIDSIPGDTKGKVLLYLHLDSKAGLMNGKVPLAALVIQTFGSAQLDVAHPHGGSRLQGAAPVVLCQALGAVPGGVDPACFVSPDAQYFQSSSKAAGVSAHVKARQGFLYPLPAAFCFLESPALFLPHAAIRCVELMRAGGASSTFDLVVHMRGGAAHEFGMVPREEVGAIEDYIRRCRLAVGAADSSEEEGGGTEDGASGAPAAQAVGDSGDDSEDEDFNPVSSSEEEEEEEEQAGDEDGRQRQPSSSSGAAKRKRGDSSVEGGSARGDGSGGAAVEGSDDDDDDEEAAEEESSEEEDSSDEEGSVELVSEDDFSTGQLESVLAGESGSSGAPRAKRQRG